MLQDFIDLLFGLGSAVIAGVVGYAKRHPAAVLLAIIALLRTLGTTVQTGQAGVLFSCGGVRRVLEPGFHPLIPFFQRVRVTPIRSVTLDLRKQRVTTADGLVYDVDATLVYHVEDPIRALTTIDNVNKGCLTLMPLLVANLLREQTSALLTARGALDAELTARARDALARWGVAVEQAGLNSVAPTRHTALVTQLRGRIHERARLVRDLLDEGTSPAQALLLVAPGRVPVGHAHARYQARRLARLAQHRQQARQAQWAHAHAPSSAEHPHAPAQPV